jgi:hypothetical protein
VSDGLAPAPLPEGLGIAAEDGPQPPLSVRLVGLTLRNRLEARDARLPQHSSNASRPPSPAAPAQKRQRRLPAPERRPPDGTRGYPGPPPGLVVPTATLALFPAVGS